ncbi:hypothetical protein VHEMI07812 [[Torrubiella] hemipterigena]|uniref:Nephrocystin 3-like N-terminal domain-containing protein n=1 Tax=[Torrubiella] hemipterigena TaxID=1531966 RepID=A0A0A1TMD8_9HYPO|nr:hypothetical protein VHEMI07812 [[Torrubiella] hemipterigena]
MSSITVNSCEATVGYFFFKDESAQRSSMNSALCAILHQLFSQESTESLIEHALPLFKRCGDELTNDFEDSWTLLLDCSEKYINDDIMCVLDALDECNSHDRQQLIRRLDQLYADKRPSTKRLKFLITSQTYDDIERSFEPVSKHAQYFRFDADKRHNEISHDISLTYLWLQLTLNIIASHPRRYGRLRDVETLLSDIPLEVSEGSDKILSRTENDITTSLLLQIVLAARRPLTLDEANFALTLAREGADVETHEQLDDACWPGDFKSDVTNICGLIINVYDGKLFFIHLTAREFLVKTPKLATSNTMTWGGSFADSAALYAIMARACMQYLLFSELTWQVRPLIQEANEKHKLFGYASTFWPLYFNARGKAEDLELL